MSYGPLFIALGPIFVIASLAMPAGVGGGLLYVPLCDFVGVSPDLRGAAALAQPLVFGATLAAICYNLGWQARHPDQVIMDPSLALAAVPLCIAGSLVGAFLNQILPALIIEILLLVVLAKSLFTCWTKGRSLWKKESQAKAEAKAAVADKFGLEAEDTTTCSPSPSVVGSESMESGSAPDDRMSPMPGAGEEDIKPIGL